jgi:fatty acid-binding protein DegV
MLQESIDFAGIADTLQASAEKIRLIFTPKDLSYLNRSKRLTGIKYLIASLAGLKPLIQVANGKMDKLSTSRGFDNAVDAIVKAVYSEMKKPVENQLAVAYAGMSVDMGGNILAQKLGEGFKSNPGYFESIIGPTIGAHCGPETVAAAFFAG